MSKKKKKKKKEKLTKNNINEENEKLLYEKRANPNSKRSKPSRTQLMRKFVRSKIKKKLKQIFTQNKLR